MVLIILIKPVTVRRQVETDSILPTKMSLKGQNIFRPRRSHSPSYLPANLLLWRFTYSWQLVASPTPPLEFWKSFFSPGDFWEHNPQHRKAHTSHLPLQIWRQSHNHGLLRLEETLLGVTETNLILRTSLQHPYVLALCLFPTEHFSYSVIYLFCLFIICLCH